MFDENRDVLNGGERRDVATHVGRGWRQIDQQMRRLAKRRAALDAEEARLLVLAKRAEVHVHLGYGTFTEYLERVCAYAPITARDRVRVAEALEALPVMTEALASGKLSYSAVKELTRVTKPDTEEDWIAAVAGCTVREIEDAVRGHHPGDLPDDRPDPAIEPRTVRLELMPEVYALFIEARRALERETGETMTDSDFMAAACRRVLAGEGKGDGGNQPRHQVSISRCRDCGRGWQEVGSTSIELSPAAIDRACCDAIELGNVDGASPEPTSRTIPAAVRRAVLARDLHRCRVPGCRSSQYVDVHHLRPRAQGGPHETSNLVTLCGRHHDAAHDGRITITGQPGALRVTHADGRIYGTPPPTTPRDSRSEESRGRAHVAPPRDIPAEVRRSLVSMGLKRHEATAAVAAAIAGAPSDADEAASHGSDATFEALLRAALRACPRSRA